MRLSTVEGRDEARAEDVVRAAVGAGATLLDTADAYALDEGDVHHNERVIGRVLAAMGEAGRAVRVVTKGGLRRPEGRWVPDGRAAHLRATCEGSVEALGRGAIDLYLLHAPDPRTAFATSVRALAQLKADGRVREVGLSNVTLAQIREAEEIVPIAAVEVELSPWVDAPLRNGIVEHCAARGIMVLAHSPLGGPKRAGKSARDPTWAALAAARETTAVEMVIAWLRDLAPVVVPIPGATTVERAREVVGGARIALGDEERAQLDERFPAAAALRKPRGTRQPADDAGGDVVLVIGIQGTGKSEHARALVAAGYRRLNRDESGGTLRELLPRLDALLGEGQRRVVLDNTYTTRAVRNEVIETAWRHGVPVRCLVADAPMEVAQVNAVRRLIARHGGSLPMPEEIAKRAKKDPVYLLPNALHRVKREMEAPEMDEGYRSIEVVPFVSVPQPGQERAGLLVMIDAIARVRDPARTESIELLPEARERLLSNRPAADASIHVFGWAPAVAHGQVTLEDLGRCSQRLRELLHLQVEGAWCPHREGPPTCWCRPPLPGLMVEAMDRARIDPGRAVLIGSTTPHRTLAGALGVRYVG